MSLPPGQPRRRLRVEGLVNARDLGGLRRRDGALTPTGVFYRSENVDAVTPAGWDQLYEVGVRTIVDLRRSDERALDATPRPSWVNTEVVDLHGFENVVFWRDYWDSGAVNTALYYEAHLATMPERAVAALSAIVAAPPGGVLFHCVHGRDRTGMIALLLLAAADVEPEQIVEDYLETVRLGVVRAAWSYRNNDEPALEALCASLGSSTEGAFRAALGAHNLPRVLSAVPMNPPQREALMTWRGSLTRAD